MLNTGQVHTSKPMRGQGCRLSKYKLMDGKEHEKTTPGKTAMITILVHIYSDPFQLHPEIGILWEDSANLTKETDLRKLRRFWTLLLSGLQSSTRLLGALKHSMHVAELYRLPTHFGP